MAKKKKVQDTSPLAMGRQQKGSAVNKKEQKAGTNTKSQSSVSNKSNKTVSSGFTVGYRSPRANTNNNSRSTSTSRNVTSQDRINQKSYGATRRGTTPTAAYRQRNTAATAAEMRRQNAAANNNLKQTQAEKSRVEHKNRFNTAKEMMAARAEEGRKQKMGENSVATKEQKETVERAIRNTPSAVKKAALDAGSGYMQTLTEIADMTASSKKGAMAKAMKLGIDPKKDKNQFREIERERAETAKKAREDNQKLYEAQRKRQEEWDEKTKGAKGLEKAYYGALESGTGMLADIGIGALTGTGQVGALTSMALRTFGSSTNQAREEGATDREARLYGALQSGKEVGSELVFPGAGLAKKAYGRAGISLAEKATNRLLRGLSGRTADIAHAGARLAGGMVEENIEEGIGWGLDPLIKEYTYGRNVRKRDAAEVMNRISADMRSNIKDENDAASASAYLSSDAFLEDTKKDYMDEGLSETEAEAVANKMREFLTASLTGDTETMERLEKEISTDVAKAHSILEDYSGKELLETIASTSLLTGVTGLPGSMTTAARGSAIRDELGDKGVRALAKTAIDFENEEDSIKGQAAKDRLDAGKELTSTQVYELAAAAQNQIETDSKREEASLDSASKRIKAENLVAPYGVNANGEMVVDDVINEKFEANAKTAETTIKNFDANREEGQQSLTDTEVRNGSRAIARWKAGVFTVEDANELNYSNTAVRSAFEEETGVDLGQYVVKDKSGKINVPATNAATKEALFAMASDNLVESAREATANWTDNVKGEVVTQVTARMGAQGSVAFQAALDDVDERNRSEYMMVANASDMLYQRGLNMGTEWNNVKDTATKMFPQIAETKLKAMYEAGLADREIAADEYRGKSVKLGEAITSMSESDRANVTGKVYVDTELAPKGTIVRAFSELARNIGVDIHLVDNLPTDSGQQANGLYHKGEIYINVNSSFEQNMGYIFMHEVTHHLKEYAPEEYAALENLVREKWFEYDDAQMQNEIAKKIDLYNRATEGKQTLTEAEALEEIIADAAHEFINDPNFANQVAEENPNLARAVLNSIRNALRMLRNVLATGSIDDETHMNSLFSQLDIFDEAEKLWLNAYTAAYQNKAALAIDNWQDEVNRQYRYSNSKTVNADSQELKGLSDDERISTAKTHAKSLANKEYTLKDSNGNDVSVKVVSSKRFKNRNGTSKPANKDFINKYIKNKNKQESIMLLDEIVESAEYVGASKPKYGHDWIDNYGKSDWEYWSAHIQDNEGNTLQAVLNITTTASGEKVLYDIDIKKEEQAINTLATSTSKHSLADTSGDVNSLSSEPTKKSNSAAAKYERGEKLTHKQFNSYYSAHKLNLRGQDNIEEQIDDIKTNGFVSTTALSNVVPAGINDFVDSEKPNYTEGRYGAREGDVVLLVPKNYLDQKNDRIENGFVPRDYEVVTVERDFQPYYELYEKAYDETNTGERFSISEQQDSDYMSAVESGDMETAQRMVDEAAAQAMPNSKILDEDGNLLLVYHGSDAEFNEFDRTKSRANMDIQGNFFSPYEIESAGYGRNIRKFYLNIENPASESEGYAALNRFKGENEAGIKAREYLIEQGFDGVMNYDEFITFDSEQSKSADPVTYDDNGNVIPLSERFNLENKDIRYSLPTQDAEGKVLSDGQMDYFKNSRVRDEHGRLLKLYHGSESAGFTVFDPSYGISSRAFFFVDSNDRAKGYSGTHDIFQARNPQSIDEVNEYINSIGNDDVAQQDGDEFVILENGQEIIRADNLSDLIIEYDDYTGIGGGAANYEVYLNIENPLVVDAQGNSWESIPFEGDIVTSNWIAEYAQSLGYDGVIINNVYDYGIYASQREQKPQTDYIVFNSNQIKDINNLNPTENPDIRYSIADEDEAKSKLAYEDAIDNSFEALEYYEQSLADLTDETAESRPIRRFNEDRIAEFYAGLKADDSVPYSDYVLEEDRVRMAQSKNDYFNNINAKWNDRWTTDGEVLNVKSVKTDVRNLIMGVMQNSDTDSQYKRELVNKTLFDIRTAYQLLKQDRPEVASELLYHSAQRMIDNVEFYVDDTFDQYKELKNYLRNTRISLGEEYWSDVDYDAFRKNNFGRLKLVKGKTNVDQIYQELEEMFPEWFNEEETMSVPDQLLQIEHVLDSVQPYKEAYSSEAAAELAFDIADDLYEIMVKGDEVRSLADTYKQRYDAKTKAMKQRHAEAMLRVRRARDEGIQAERQKFREYKEKQKERTAHRKEFDSIQKSYDTLTKRLLDNTADSNIPEQYKKELAGLLAAFDLQTVKSKQLEKTRMRRSQSAIKMSAIRTALRQIETRTQEFFHVNDAIVDIIDELLGANAEYPAAASIEGKTIDELSNRELQRIDTLLKALVHEFNTYKNVRIEDRNAKAQDIADAQAASALEHAEKFGPGNDWEGPIGWLDGIINMDEMTPAYLFRQIDRKNEGLGLMWKELERAQDKYIRNTEQLTQWMQDITGKYHNTGRGSNKYGAKQIEEWRRSRSQVEFNLTHGSIKLTPAQMMSVACLANRPQAYQHMVGAGVVVAPVGFQAKTETDLKRKSNRGLSLILTDADIKLIVEQLTPEQKKMAEDLQQLMANQMAEWGNEASMDVIGIRLFEEKDYFPIKSDKAALVRDWTGEDVEQAIRNFGFTKAVQPNAKNSIMIEDIFDVVTEHCNNMNLYNSYSKALNDFMKVYNKHVYKELAEGRFSDQSLGQILAHAYSSKATNYIMSFIKDLNGNVSRGRVTGIEKMLQGQLANAKKASVFANIRVLLQQPTAITRAFAVISPKYLKGIKIERGAMEEMFEHCPIAKWKSWGYYDINMGKQIEDIIMNDGNFLEDLATQAYGAADNVTWTAIWQMVKSEMKDTHPDVVEGTDEFWYQCNERMREIVDLTQVVDSPMHRSHAMRDKGFTVKSLTSFMAEPTLTFNMVRDGYIRAREAWAQGNKKEAASIMNKTMSVYVLQAAAVAAAAAIADALRGKSPDGGDDEEDKTFFASWWANTIANFQDELKLWNKLYYIKDIFSLFEGWDNKSLYMQGIISFRDGYNQMTKKLTEGSKVSWWKIYSNLFGGLGYMTGIPIKTLMRDGRAVFEFLGGQLPESWVGEKKSDAVISEDSAFGKLIAPKNSDKGKASSVVNVSAEEHWYDYGNSPITVKDGSAIDKLLNRFGLNLTKAEKAAALKAQEQKEFEKKGIEIADSVSEYSGEERAKKTWSKVSTYLKEKEGKSVNELVEAGDFATLRKYKGIYLAAGNSEDYFDERIYDASKKALKKSIVYNATDSQINAQENIKDYLLSHGMTEAEMSDIAYRSDTARDMKVAFRLGDKELMMESLEPLVNAGLTYEDLERLWKNRNRMDMKKYDGRYKDKLKSTGTYVWPCQGTITSGYGARSAPTAGASSWHAAIDIGAAAGTPVGAADGGTVIFAGWNGAGGKTVKVKHDDGTITYYQHLSWWDVHEGDVVGQGQQVGKVGSTGVSTGPHLDFRVETPEGKLVNPMDYLS